MRNAIMHAYGVYRGLGWTAHEALWAARVKVAFRDEAEQGRVRLMYPIDDDYDYSFLDTWSELSPRRIERIKKDLAARIEKHGLYGIAGQRSCPSCGEWLTVDSCYGFIGDELVGSPYVIDIMSNTLDALSEDGREHCASNMAQGDTRVAYFKLYDPGRDRFRKAYVEAYDLHGSLIGEPLYIHEHPDLVEVFEVVSPGYRMLLRKLQEKVDDRDRRANAGGEAAD